MYSVDKNSYEILRLLQIPEIDKRTDKFSESAIDHSFAFNHFLSVVPHLAILTTSGYVGVNHKNEYFVKPKGMAAFESYDSDRYPVVTISKKTETPINTEMNYNILNHVVFYLWKRSQPTAMVTMMYDFKKQGIDIPNIMELEEELVSRHILLISGAKTKMYSLSHYSRTDLAKQNPKNQNTMYEYLIRRYQPLPLPDKPSIHNVITTPNKNESTIATTWYKRTVFKEIVWPVTVILLAALLIFLVNEIYKYYSHK